jgi:hypothetical protein
MKLFYTLSAVLLAAAPAHAGLSLSVRDLPFPKIKLKATLLVSCRRRPRPRPRSGLALYGGVVCTRARGAGAGRREEKRPAGHVPTPPPPLRPPSHPIDPHPTRATQPQVTATDTTVKDLSTLNLEGAVETVLADDVVFGGTYNYNAAVAKPEEIYIKKAFDVKLVRRVVGLSNRCWVLGLAWGGCLG